MIERDVKALLDIVLRLQEKTQLLQTEQDEAVAELTQVRRDVLRALGEPGVFVGRV